MFRRRNSDVSGSAITILQRLTDALFAVDTNWNLTYANEMAARLVGRAPADLIGKSVWDFYPQALGPGINDPFRRAFETKIPLSFECHGADTDRYFDCNVHPSETGLTVLLRDITDARTLQQIQFGLRTEVAEILNQPEVSLPDMLQQCAEAIVKYVDAAFARIWLVNEQHRVLELYASAGMYTHLNGRHSRIPIGELEIGHIAATALPHLTNNIPDEPLIHDKEWAVRENMVAFAGYPLDLEGKVIGVVGIFSHHPFSEDVFDSFSAIGAAIAQGVGRRRIEEELVEREEILRAAAQVAELGTWMRDWNQDVVSWDPQCKAIFGLPPDAEVGVEPFLDRVHPDDRAAMVEAIRVVRDQGVGVEHRYEFRIIRPDGVQRWVRTSGRTILRNPADRSSARFVGTVLDITDSKTREEVLQRANDAKDEFLATVSHELRTPLTSIYGWTKILQSDEVVRRRVQKALDVIERNVRAQAQLVEDLISVSKITSGKMRIAPRWISCSPVVTAAVEAVRPSATAKQVTINFSGCGEDKMFADPDRLQQVIWNLLTNSIKFTPQGGSIEVESYRTDHGVEMRVSDNGEGIDPALQPYIFDRFRQGNSSNTRKHGGLGLGLNIVKHIVQMHGGHVEVHSEGSGKGSTFILEFPDPLAKKRIA